MLPSTGPSSILSSGLRAAGLVAPLLLAGAAVAGTELVSVSSSGVAGNGPSTAPAVSGDGRFVAFLSHATNLVPGDVNGKRDVFLRDRLLGVTELVSVALSPAGADDSALGWVAVSDDGRYVAFESMATNLVPGDQNQVYDVFVRDRLLGTTERVSVTSAGLEVVGNRLSLSADGRYVTFASFLDGVVPGDQNGESDVFVRDRLLGTTERVSVATGGAEADGPSTSSSLSADGRYVVFYTRATNLDPAYPSSSGVSRIMVRDLQAGTTVQASVNSAGAGISSVSGSPRISADGRFVAFASGAFGVVPNDPTNIDVYVRDLALGTTTRVSVATDGTGADNPAQGPAITRDGRWVAYHSSSSNLTPCDGGGGGVSAVIVHDRVHLANYNASRDSLGEPANASSVSPSFSADGATIVFESDATNLVPGDANGVRDVFAFTFLPAPVLECFGDGLDSTVTIPCPCANAGDPSRGCRTSTSTSAGSLLTAEGSFAEDRVILHASGMVTSTTMVFLQGDARVAGGSPFGDGIRCAGGQLVRLGVASTPDGGGHYPSPAQPSIRERAALLGAPIPGGATRWYQAYFRDTSTTFCPAPAGNVWNVTNAVEIVWP